MYRNSSGIFFFQAEDGIRDHCVTGVQTCALPISLAYILGTTKDGVRPVEVESGLEHDAVRRLPGADLVIRPPDERARPLPARSEERRVGKECRLAGWPCRYKKKSQWNECRKAIQS